MPRKVFTAGEVLAAADVNSFLMDQTVMSFAGTAARGSAIGTAVEGMVTYIEDSNLIEAYNASAWVTVANAGTASFNLVQTLYFTSSGTFTKADYPWLRAVVVKAQGAGAGGGGSTDTNGGSGGGGGGGAYCEKFYLVADLSSSETVTVGAGGAGGTTTGNGSAGGFSTFKSMSASGGGEGVNGSAAQGGIGGLASGGDLNLSGGDGQSGSFTAAGIGLDRLSFGGGSQLGETTRAEVGQGAGLTGKLYGGGGSGGYRINTSFVGGTGANGIVIIELYA
jgi:hypothetical protein